MLPDMKSKINLGFAGNLKFYYLPLTVMLYVIYYCVITFIIYRECIVKLKYKV